MKVFFLLVANALLPWMVSAPLGRWRSWSSSHSMSPELLRVQHPHSPAMALQASASCDVPYKVSPIAMMPGKCESVGGVSSEKAPVSQHCGLTWKCRRAFFLVMPYPLFCFGGNILFLFRGDIFFATIQYLNVFLAKVHFDTEQHLERRGWKCQSENGTCLIANIYQIIFLFFFFE